VVRARDRVGLVHFVVPLAHSSRKLGALIAGQVFDQYPDRLAVETTAKRLNLSPDQVWEEARWRYPVNSSMLEACEELLATLGSSVLRNRYHTLEDVALLAEHRRAKEVLQHINDELEKRVEERTAELQQAQKRALRAERLAAIGQMVAGLAHESRNSLQRIQASLTRLSYRLQDNPEALGLVDNIQKAQDDLHRLFEEVRGYAAPIRLELLPCALDEIWRDAWADLCSAQMGRQAELRAEPDGTDLRCEVSPFHLKQVFRNLFQNALAAAPDPVEVVVRCSDALVEGQAGVRISVSDNGPGFTDEQRQRAFVPFFTTKAKGTGLGLPICKRIVKAHQGTIELDASDEPGANIVITLPRRML
jgi:signal transduction histidine kinase